MAVGQPATGIGGIYYLILFIGILVNKLQEKISSLINSRSYKEKIKRIIKQLPPLAFALCIILLIYMNVIGIRFVITSGVGNSTPIIDFGITDILVVSVFLITLLLFHIRARQKYFNKQFLRRAPSAP